MTKSHPIERASSLSVDSISASMPASNGTILRFLGYIVSLAELRTVWKLKLSGYSLCPWGLVCGRLLTCLDWMNDFVHFFFFLLRRLEKIFFITFPISISWLHPGGKVNETQNMKMTWWVIINVSQAVLKSASPQHSAVLCSFRGPQVTHSILTEPVNHVSLGQHPWPMFTLVWQGSRVTVLSGQFEEIFPLRQRKRGVHTRCSDENTIPSKKERANLATNEENSINSICQGNTIHGKHSSCSFWRSWRRLLITPIH